MLTLRYLLIVQLLFFLLLCTSQFSSWAALRSSFYKEVASQKLIYPGGDISIISRNDDTCTAISTTSCNGVWSCMKELCKHNVNNPKYITISVSSTDERNCDHTNTENLSKYTESLFESVKVMFYILPIATVISIILYGAYVIATCYSNDIMALTATYLLMIMYTIAKLMLFSLSIMINIYKRDFQQFVRDYQPAELNERELIATILLCTQTVAELVIGVIGLYLLSMVIREKKYYLIQN